jgi:DNA-directed DNA polymerase III PolC
MDIFEFELRYRSYSWLLAFFGEEISEEKLLRFIQRTDKGVLQTKLVESSLEQLREATRMTYTTEKKEILTRYENETHHGKSKAIYLERLEYELKVIHEMGYNTYFLVVWDYIHRAKANKIMVGPGRWSVAGSLLSFVLWITALDPLEYDLIFERFLNPGRISMPDIDTDFEDTYREKVIEYITQRYGKDNVAHIGTYMSLAAKAAFKDVARVMGIKFDQANKLTSMVTEKTVALSAEKNKDLQDAIKADSRIQKVIDVATAIEWTVRQTWVHACGMIIAPRPVVTYSPVQFPPKSGSKTLRDESRIVSQYEGPVIENLGLLKMDILWLRNLSIIKHTAKIIQARAKIAGTPTPELIEEILTTMSFTPPLDDQKAYALFGAGDTSWIFQFESDGMRSWLKKLKPNRFDDLIAMVSLYRPGPMEYIPHYIDRKFGIQEVTYMPHELENTLIQSYGEEVAKEQNQKLIEDLDTFMSITYGIPVYQEQLMRLVQAMAWFSMAEADNLRKWVGKKIREVIEKIKVEFIKKAAEHRGYKKETSTWIYEKMIEPAADYSFNKSHAACYAFISYQTARLKAHYPLEFHAALLRSVEQEPDKLAWFIQEVQLQGIEITPPRVTSAFEHVSAVGDHLEIWFLGIKGVGSEVAAQIERERSSAQFSSLADFLTRCGAFLNKKSLESLAKAGALDDRWYREQLVEAVPQMVERCKQQQMQNGWLFGGGGWGLFWITEFPLPNTPITDPLFALRREKEVFNIPLSCHPFDGLYPWCRAKYNFITAVNVEGYGEFRICGMVLGLSKWMRGGWFLQVEDITGQMEFYFMEKVDLEPLDIVYITWYKGQRFPKADCIRVLSHRKLVEKAKSWGLYDPAQTVASVRRARKGELVQQSPPVVTPLLEEELLPDDEIVYVNTISPELEEEHIDEEKQNDDLPVEAESTDELLVFPVPEDATTLQAMVQIIKQFQWPVCVQIGTKEVTLSPEGVEQIKQLMW